MGAAPRRTRLVKTMSREERIAYLEARVEALEEALTIRSLALRRLQKHLPREGLLLLTRLLHDLPPLPHNAYDLKLWQETTELTPADVEETLTDLWRSLTAVEDESDDA